LVNSEFGAAMKMKFVHFRPDGMSVGFGSQEAQ